MCDHGCHFSTVKEQKARWCVGNGKERENFSVVLDESHSSSRLLPAAMLWAFHSSQAIILPLGHGIKKKTGVFEAFLSGEDQKGVNDARWVG